VQAKLLSSLFLTFLKMGPLTFGGGYALLPVIEREIVDKKGWLRSNEVADIVAVAGSAPGAVAVNSAAFIGYRIAGAKGAVAALLGILLPTFFIIIVLSQAYMLLKDDPKVEAALKAIRATVVALIVYAAYKIGKSAIFDMSTGAIAAASIALLAFGGGHIHPAWIIAFGAAGGIAVVTIRSMFGKKTKLDDDEPVYDYMI